MTNNQCQQRSQSSSSQLKGPSLHSDPGFASSVFVGASLALSDYNFVSPHRSYFNCLLFGEVLGSTFGDEIRSVTSVCNFGL